MSAVELLKKALEASMLQAAAHEEALYLEAIKTLNNDIIKFQNPNKEAGTLYELY